MKSIDEGIIGDTGGNIHQFILKSDETKIHKIEYFGGI